MRKPDRHILAGIAFLLIFVSVIGYFEVKAYRERPKHKCCTGISVECNCEPGLCMCLKYGKTCTDSCYDEAVRTGRTK